MENTIGSEPVEKIAKKSSSRNCPYLDTINRSILDFDFEKLCSVSLLHLNVYACLVCGKYFQGRGPKSHAYTHSVQELHHVFLNLETHRFYCLPDNYEIFDSSLEDITYVLNPTFTKSQILGLDKITKMLRAYDGSTYYPGMLGLNNIKANDYCNVVLQALAHVTPVRNFFLQSGNYSSIKRPPGDQMFLLVQRFGELVCKLWNPRHFKAHVSPHEMLQAVSLCSKKKFQFTVQGDGVNFLSWLINSLHMALNGTRKKSSVISRAFRGHMKVYTRRLAPEGLTAEEIAKLETSAEYQETCEEQSYMYLSCDLPPPPLFPDEMKENIIPQVPLSQLLGKFDGVSEKEYKTWNENFLKRFEILSLPSFLILVIKRFEKNRFIFEKNATIVNFPIKNLDFRDLLAPDVRDKVTHTAYDLVANVVHDGESVGGTYRLHVLHKGTGKWFELQDLRVEEVLPQMITLSESYIQIYQLKTDKSTGGENGANTKTTPEK